MLLLAVAMPIALAQIRDSYPHLSPDGWTLAFHSNRSGDQAIWLADSDGNSPAYDGWPSWSPDGRWLFLASNRDQPPNVGEIDAIRPDGTGPKRLTDVLSKAQPSPGQDGKRLYFYENIEIDQFEFGHISSIEISFSE